MKHCGTKQIETKRLLLRRFRKDDYAAMYKNWASDPDVTRFLTWPTHESPELTEHLLRMWVADYAKPDHYQWAIELRDLRQPIGSIAVVELDDAVGKAHIGYCIGKPWWHQGIATETLQAVIRFLFQEVGIQRIEARHDVNNPRSGAVMRSCGMTFEGIHSRSDRNNQGICDTAWYAILTEEFHQGKVDLHDI